MTPLRSITLRCFACDLDLFQYNDVIMDAIASQITRLTIIYSIFYSDSDQRKHQSPAALSFVRGIHRGPLNSPHKWPVDDVIMLVLIIVSYVNVAASSFITLFRDTIVAVISKWSKYLGKQSHISAVRNTTQLETAQLMRHSSMFNYKHKKLIHILCEGTCIRSVSLLISFSTR